MDLTVQIIVRNDKATILKALESVRPIASEILIADLGSQDGSIDLCHGCTVLKFDERAGYDQVRQSLVDKSRTDWQMYLHPWESLAQGHREVANAQTSQRVNVLQQTILTREVRVWRKCLGLKFQNPVYEFLETDASLAPIYIFSDGRNDYRRNLELIERWKKNSALSPEPFYYQALTLLALHDYDGFLNASSHYMYLDTKQSVSTVLNRYYYAMVQIYYCRKATPALQNLNICIETRPLMAEFWCLIGDLYYILYNKYELSKAFYENGVFLGSRRLSTDLWPMDIAKYDEYPNMMISSCDKIIGSNSLYRNITNQ
jgi:hypothetical protein